MSQEMQKFDAKIDKICGHALLPNSAGRKGAKPKARGRINGDLLWNW
jgi:hypothetical protein